MNKFLNKLELKWGKYAIERLPMYMLILYAIGYVMQLVNPNIIYILSLNPYAILHGQVWRLITWVLIPPDTGNLLLLLIMLYFYYQIGMAMERTWGPFNFNLYIFSGMLFTVLGAFCMYCYYELFHAGYSARIDAVFAEPLQSIYGGSQFYADKSRVFSTYYINMSIFLAFAVTYPDMQVLMMFFVPIKVKFLGIIYLVLAIVGALETHPLWPGDPNQVDMLFAICASLLNFFIFFAANRRRSLGSPQSRARQKQFRRSMREATVRQNVIAKHKCAICGRTSDEYPDLEFRFCSKCAGNYEYCKDHLYTHRHIEKNG